MGYRRVLTAPLTNHGPQYFQHDDIIDIDVILFTLPAPILPIQGHALYSYIMVDVAVPWFDPVPPIGHQGTQKWLTKQ